MKLRGQTFLENFFPQPRKDSSGKSDAKYIEAIDEALEKALRGDGQIAKVQKYPFNRK
jgi:hypothetical protein